MMNVNKSDLEVRLIRLSQQRTKLIATLTATEGAIAEVNYWLNHIKAPTPKVAVKGAKKDD